MKQQRSRLCQQPESQATRSVFSATEARFMKGKQMKSSYSTAAVAVVAMLLMASSGQADTTFRGIVRDQGNNLLFSNVLNRFSDTGRPYYIDINDDFARGGDLNGSEVDGLQLGFVPPFSGVPDGPLTGVAADEHGRWQTLNGGLTTHAENGGWVDSNGGLGPAVAALPWRVDPGLGDYYLIEMSAKVAAGESISLGYLGDFNTLTAAEGLAGQLGQLVLGVERGTGANQDQVTWTASWVDGDIKRSFSNTVSVAAEEEINLQLGWLDQGSDDLFDAWLGTSTTNTRLIGGSMNTAIDVYAVGFELFGTESMVGGFTSAVPEPAGQWMGLCGLAAAILARRRQS